jgi:hypothetical protein
MQASYDEECRAESSNEPEISGNRSQAAIALAGKADFLIEYASSLM